MSSSSKETNEESPLLPGRGSSLPTRPPPVAQQVSSSMADSAAHATRGSTPSPVPVLASAPSPTPAVASIADQPVDDGTIPAPETPGPGRLPKVDSSAPLPWGAPAGLGLRGPNDVNLVIFRRALGISNTATSTTPPSATMTTIMATGRRLEEGGGGGGSVRQQRQRRKAATGIYREVQRSRVLNRRKHLMVEVLLYGSHFVQVVIGAVLTALGPAAGTHAVLITVLGAVNTVLAGMLAMAKGQGLPDRLRRDASEFRKLQDWIEETEALLAVGVIGRNKKEVGYLVELAFKKYNAARRSEENNWPDGFSQLGADDGTGKDRDGNNRASVMTGKAF